MGGVTALFFIQPIKISPLSFLAYRYVESEYCGGTSTKHQHKNQTKKNDRKKTKHTHKPTTTKNKNKYKTDDSYGTLLPIPGAFSPLHVQNQTPTYRLRSQSRPRPRPHRSSSHTANDDLRGSQSPLFRGVTEIRTQDRPVDHTRCNLPNVANHIWFLTYVLQYHSVPKYITFWFKN